MAGDEAEVAHERAYVEWAYQRLDRMLRGTDGMEHAAGDVGTYRALRKFQEARRESLLAARDKLVIGRLDYTSPRAEALGHGTLYIGKTHVDGDDSDNHAVIDWRADAAEAFYQATRTHPMGIGRRRTIAMRGRTVTGLSDELLTTGFKPPVARPVVQPPPIEVKIEKPAAPPAPAPPEPMPAGRRREAPLKARRLGSRRASRSASRPSSSADEVRPEPPERAEQEPAEGAHNEFEIRAEDLLLEELARERTAEMSEVVATIQADQDRLIRAPANQPLIIQGGPGTGKTIVGLHRAAYVLYEQRRRGLDASVLVVGPNPAFMDYINAVLPSLGEASATQLALDQLAVSHLTAAERTRIRVRSERTPLAARALGDQRMAQAVEAAVWQTPEPRDLELGFGRFVLRLSQAEVAEVIARLRRASGSYREARAGMVEGLATAFHANYQSRQGVRFGNAEEELESIATATRRLLAEDDRELMPAAEARTIVMSLLQDRDVLRSVGFDEAEVGAVLVQEQSSSRSFPWAREHLPLLDEAARLTRGEPARYAHVVVDEAQDLSPMQWRMLTRRVQRGSITILGDLAQSMSVWSARTWSDVAKRIVGQGDVTLGELRLGYRVPRQVMDFVAPLASLAAPGLASPVSFRTGPDPVVVAAPSADLCNDAVRIAVASASGTVAIICPRGMIAQVRKGLSSKQQEHITVLDAEQARGREFDTVCVVEPEKIIAESIRPAQTLYVALTRPTKSLVIVHSLDLPDVLGGSSQSVSRVALDQLRMEFGDLLRQRLAALVSGGPRQDVDSRPPSADSGLGDSITLNALPVRPAWPQVAPVGEGAVVPAWQGESVDADDVGAGRDSGPTLDETPGRLRRVVRRLFGRGD